MNNRKVKRLLERTRIFLISLCFAATGAHAGLTDIASAPLITSSTTAVLPNLMFVLDDSGSMNWDFLPDWSNDNYCKAIAGTFGAPCCRSSSNTSSPNGESGDGSGSGSSSCWARSTTTAAPFNYWRGHPPFLSSDFNMVYYNPAVTYTPPLNADGTSKPSQTTYTAVKNDYYDKQSTTSINLTTQFPDTKWCTDTTCTTCLRNDNYLLPGTVSGVTYDTFCPTVASGTGQTATGSFASPTTSSSRALGPHYYAIIPGEHCTAKDLRTCSAATAPTGIYTEPAKVRWCNSTARTTCQAIKTAAYQYIRYPGIPIPGSSGTSASATITIAGSGSSSVSQVTVNGANLLSSATAATSSTSTLATNLRDKIRTTSGLASGSNTCATPTPVYCASVSGNTVTIKAPPGAITYTPVVTMGGAAPSTATLTIVDPPGANTNTSFSGITVNGQQIMSAASSNSTSINTVAGNIETRIDACTASVSGTCGVAGFSASRINNVLTITAPASMGGITFPLVATKAVGTGNITATSTNFVVPGVMTATPTAFTGGVNPITATTVPGSFQRIDIVSGTTSYPEPGKAVKASTRSDCAGTTCTYAEEMTNFANWWTYYHSRMQMMKSAASIAFQPIDSRYRVGIFTINTSSTATGTNFLDIGTFDSTQKSSWYAKLFAAYPSGGTPLRAALSKAGNIYAGNVGTDPVQYSCQQNFTILSTDGYWNGAGGYKMDSGTMGNEDGSAARPMLDGNNTADTLSDTAYYYYVNDLRPGGTTGALGTDVSEDNVPINSKDTASHQHMTTFTLGLGITGYMGFSNSYDTDTSGDFFAIKSGSAAGSGVCSWQTSGACNWPTPSSDSQANIDDLWHAAVNGRGTYFAATNPTTLASGLSNALAGVSARSGSSAAATTSNPNVTSGDNFVFSSTFTTVDWTGELVRQQLDLGSGAVLAAIDWSARDQLDAKTSAASDSRTIHTFNPGGGTNLKPFLWGSLSGAEQAYFGSAKVATLSQGLTGANLTDASGENLVNFIRGHRGNEGQLTDPAKFYRQRAHVLGDIVSAEAVYVKSSMYNYTDTGYSAFKDSNATRQGVVYAAANDGMLHAFNADTGAEMWAYIPSLVLPNLYKLADVNYATGHQYYVDGTPTVGDAYIGGSWKTILVGGLNAGGRGYYALDITDPANPAALWEFTYDTAATGLTTDANLGYTYGNPVITKKSDGTWVVLASSGYNNVSPGNGGGYLYVLSASSGAKLTTLSTGVGDTTTPSGLSRINAWTDDGMTNNTALRAYGGDGQGNLWRFDINNNIGAAGYDAQLLAYFRGSSGGIQPIVVKPELGECNGKPVVLAGTGRYLGVSDLSDTSVQSFYAIKDELLSSGYGNVRSDAAIVAQTMTSSGSTKRTVSNNAVDFSTDHGWRLDFSLSPAGERNNTDPNLALGTLVFTTNVPNTSACTVGGNSWIYYLDFCKGSYVSTSADNVAGESLGNALATRPVVVRLPNNTIVSLTRLSDSTTVTTNIPVPPPGGSTRRVSWRELINDQ